MKRKLLKWVLGWAVAGLIVPPLILLQSTLSHSGFGMVDMVLWPSSIGLMAVADAPTPYGKLDLAEIYAMLIAVNGALYLLVGLVTSPVVFLGLRARRNER